MLTRFAPSPTGYLHLGHVVNAVHVWRAARQAGGHVQLRIEDHDRVRCRPEYETAILEDLEWLGFTPDAGLRPLIRQSDRGLLYDDALMRLRSAHHVYVCDCPRRRIAGARYDGRCRDRGLSDGPGRGLRVQIEPGDERFTDLRLGTIVQSPADQCGDVLVRDRDGHWTYQFAVSVDDMLQQITHVIRGMDLLSSTARQLRLARMLGRRDTPVSLHHALILRPDGEKLSKAGRATGVRELRSTGMNATDVIEMAMASLAPRLSPAN